MRLHLPEPPSLNQMMDWRGAGWYVYYGKQQSYMKLVRLLLPAPPPDAPWETWELDSHFRLWNRRDPLELNAGLKWAVDVLQEEGWVLDDGPDFLVRIGHPTQEIDRSNRGVTVTIQRGD